MIQTPATTRSNPSSAGAQCSRTSYTFSRREPLLAHGGDVEHLLEHRIKGEAFDLFVHRQLVVLLEQINVGRLVDHNLLRLLVIFGAFCLVGGFQGGLQQGVDLFVLIERTVARQPFLSDSNQ
jgi:hypothetical protein